MGKKILFAIAFVAIIGAGLISFTGTQNAEFAPPNSPITTVQ